MADNFEGKKYLRVLTPKTTNGVVPKLIQGKQVYKETHLPFSSLPLMQSQNTKLKAAGHEHLQHLLEIVGDNGPEETAQTIAPRPFRPQRFPRSNPQPGMGRKVESAKNKPGKTTKQTIVSPPESAPNPDTDNNNNDDL